jgi:hypothetical protein
LIRPKPGPPTLALSEAAQAIVNAAQVARRKVRRRPMGTAERSPTERSTAIPHHHPLLNGCVAAAVIPIEITQT